MIHPTVADLQWKGAGPFFAAGVLLAMLDQASKWLLGWWMAGEKQLALLPGIVNFSHVHNPAGAFGLFASGRFFLIASAVAVLVAMVVGYPWIARQGKAERIALLLVWAGTLGNLIDRLRIGVVIDFIDLDFWPLKAWPVFNLADICISLGVAILAWRILTGWPREDKP